MQEDPIEMLLMPTLDAGKQSETDLEKRLLEGCRALGYEFVELKDRNSVVRNFRVQIQDFNSSVLNNTPLSDAEFKRLYTQITGKGIFASAKTLRDKVVLERDNGSKVYITLFDARDWCNNLFQITHQTSIVGDRTHRYDVTILVNGLPLGQIELKAVGGDLKVAFDQVQRYRRESFAGLYNFLQVFIISNGVDTKYFANNDGDINWSQAFFWGDIHNNRITRLSEFVQDFLTPCHFAKMIARFTILRESSKEILIMRPYQVYGSELLMKQALESESNGFIWHATGSGKTITAFKTADVLAKSEKFKKVFFVVDRNDLDNQTLAEFNAFAPGSVDATDSTATLLSQITDPNVCLIVTTIQKLANAVKSRHEALAELTSQHVALLFDECHRTQFGLMHSIIRKHFKNAQFFGFTGTPIFPETAGAQDRTTTDVFGKCLHTYLAKDAIKDKNVLPFQVEYVPTLTAGDNAAVSISGTDPVWRAPERVSLVVDDILSVHPQKTMYNKHLDRHQYNAILAADSVHSAIAYFDELQRREGHNLKIATVFSYEANEDISSTGESGRDGLARAITAYNETFGTNYDSSSEKEYITDVQRRVKNLEIDIVIVVRMLLTGFDSKTLNTLYLDAKLQHHGLMQACSRTNRVEKETKKYGNIRIYRDLKANLDTAIKLYSQTDKIDEVLAKPYESYKKDFTTALAELRTIARDAASVDLLETEDEQAAFVEAFRKTSSAIQSMRPLDEFNFTAQELGITEQQFLEYQSKYLLIYDRVTRGRNTDYTLLNQIDFAIGEIWTDVINVGYIYKLIGQIDLSSKNNTDKAVEYIIEQIDQSASPDVRGRAEVLKQFLTEKVPTLTADDAIQAELHLFQAEKRSAEVTAFAAGADIDLELLESVLSDYAYTGIFNREEVARNVTGTLLEKRRKLDAIKHFAEHIHERY